MFQSRPSIRSPHALGSAARCHKIIRRLERTKRRQHSVRAFGHTVRINEAQREGLWVGPSILIFLEIILTDID